MKTRYGFVSNSSSSSFIIINARYGYKEFNYSGTLVVDKDFGTVEFGWGPETLYRIEDRIIFSYIQAKQIKRDDLIQMLEKIILENSNCSNILWIIDPDAPYEHYQAFCYIDHQSSSIEGANLEMFDSEATLKDFIFGKDSRIILDNDNY